jgi:hypothetical protein
MMLKNLFFVRIPVFVISLCVCSVSHAAHPLITDDTGTQGKGRATYNFFFIATKEMKPWAFHLNLGYIRNEIGLMKIRTCFMLPLLRPLML